MFYSALTTDTHSGPFGQEEVVCAQETKNTASTGTEQSCFQYPFIIRNTTSYHLDIKMQQPCGMCDRALI